MVKKERELQEAYSKREKAERLLSNLENLKKEGAIDEAQYESMKSEYTQMLNSANTEIEQIKSEISKELESTQRDLNIYKQELSNLEVRFKVGELSADAYRKLEQRTRSKLERTQAKVSELKRLLDSKTSADVGGYVEIKKEAKKVGGVTGVEMKREVKVGYKPSAGGMTISDIFSRSFEIYKENPVIIVPSLIPIAWAIIATFTILAGVYGTIAGGFLYGDFEEFLTTLITTLIIGIAIFVIVFIILLILAEGMTIVMVRDAFEGRGADLSSAWESTKGKIGALLIASILVAVIVGLGYICLIIPGLILTFLLYFVAQAIMIDDEGAVGSLKASYRFVMSNLGDSVIIILISIAIAFILSIIPIIGDILLLLAMPFLISLATLLYIDRR